jgi:hypothetical protein
MASGQLIFPLLLARAELGLCQLLNRQGGVKSLGF